MSIKTNDTFNTDHDDDHYECEKEIARLRGELALAHVTNESWKDQLAAKDKRIAKLEYALRYYADGGTNWVVAAQAVDAKALREDE